MSAVRATRPVAGPSAPPWARPRSAAWRTLLACPRLGPPLRRARASRTPPSSSRWASSAPPARLRHPPLHQPRQRPLPTSRQARSTRPPLRATPPRPRLPPSWRRSSAAHKSSAKRTSPPTGIGSRSFCLPSPRRPPCLPPGGSSFRQKAACSAPMRGRSCAQTDRGRGPRASSGSPVKPSRAGSIRSSCRGSQRSSRGRRFLHDRSDLQARPLDPARRGASPW